MGIVYTFEDGSLQLREAGGMDHDEPCDVEQG